MEFTPKRAVLLTLLGLAAGAGLYLTTTRADLLTAWKIYGGLFSLLAISNVLLRLLTDIRLPMSWTFALAATLGLLALGSLLGMSVR